jgi:hypothetical protein
VELWLVALIVLGIAIVAAAVAWDTGKAFALGGERYRAARKRRAAEAEQREGLHHLTHPDE